jgi:hypothetical protein
MSVDSAIRRASEAGVSIIRNGENLVLRAPAPPAVEVAEISPRLGLAQEPHGGLEPFSQHEVTVFQSAVPKGGEGGGSELRSRSNRRATSQVDDPDPNPDLPWPQPGETVLPGWGTRV